MDQYSILTDIPFVRTQLRDEALLWYRSSYETWDPTTPPLGKSFALLCATILHDDLRLQDQWANRKQPGMVFEYVTVLTTLTMRFPGLSQTQVLDKFIHSYYYPRP
jgi:hypothetical protein